MQGSQPSWWVLQLAQHELITSGVLVQKDTQLQASMPGSFPPLHKDYVIAKARLYGRVSHLADL